MPRMSARRSRSACAPAFGSAYASRSVSLLALLLAAAPLALFSAGCAHGLTAEERQIDELRDELAKVQSASDKFEERLGKLEVDSADVRPDGMSGAGGGEIPRGASSPQPARALSSPRPIATPPLRVVHLGADGTEESGGVGETAGAVGSPQADEPPLRIQGSGSDAAIYSDKGEKQRRPQDAPGAGTGGNTAFFTNANLGPSLSSHSASRPSALDEEAKHSYDAALSLVNAKRYSEALDALAGFLVHWPDHPNADNAMYWRGECYFAQGDFSNAASEFEGLLARFPLGNKAPDALLKLGLSAQKLGDVGLARQRFDRLRREFPHSHAAKRIPEGAQTVRSAPPPRSTSGAKP
jgi:tol-pal system protein YbgF